MDDLRLVTDFSCRLEDESVSSGSAAPSGGSPNSTPPRKRSPGPCPFTVPDPTPTEDPSTSNSRLATFLPPTLFCCPFPTVNDSASLLSLPALSDFAVRSIGWYVSMLSVDRLCHAIRPGFVINWPAGRRIRYSGGGPRVSTSSSSSVRRRARFGFGTLAASANCLFFIPGDPGSAIEPHAGWLSLVMYVLRINTALKLSVLRI